MSVCPWATSPACPLLPPARAVGLLGPFSVGELGLGLLAYNANGLSCFHISEPGSSSG